MTHNEVAALVRSIILESWADEIYDFANVYARYDAGTEWVAKVAIQHFTVSGLLPIRKGRKLEKRFQYPLSIGPTQ